MREGKAMEQGEPDEIYAASLAWSRDFLKARGVAFEDIEQDGKVTEGHQFLKAELHYRQWKWKYTSGGRGFQVSARKGWYPSTFFELARIEGDTLTAALTRVVAEAIKKDDEMVGRRVGAQFETLW
jgi:hypothetical protein